MSIEQHAEAAAKEFWDTTDVTFAMLEEMIQKHMRSAIDEATAPLRARIAVLEGLGPLIEEYGKQLMFFGIHGDMRYQHLANEVLSLAKTILKGGA